MKSYAILVLAISGKVMLTFANPQNFAIVNSQQFGQASGSNKWVPGEYASGYGLIRNPNPRPPPFLVYTPERNMFTKPTTTTKGPWPVWAVLNDAAVRADYAQDPSKTYGDMIVGKVPGMTQYYPRTSGISGDAPQGKPNNGNGYYIRNNPLNTVRIDRVQKPQAQSRSFANQQRLFYIF